MKLAKKWMVGLSAIGLTIGLTACGNDDTKSPNEGDYTLSDVLNSKKEYEVVVTDKDNEEDGHVVWGGFIGKGNIEGVFLDGTMYDFGYNELKNLSKDEFEESLNDMGKDYMSGKFPRQLVTAKGTTELLTNVGNEGDEKTPKGKADAVSLNLKFNKKEDEDSGLKKSVSDPNYTKVSKKSENSEWATIEAGNQTVSDDYEDYAMHIKLGKGKDVNLKLDNVKETKDKHKNVKINDYGN